VVDGGGSHRSNWPYGYQWGEYDSGKREGGVKGSGTIYVYGGFPEAEKRHRLCRCGGRQGSQVFCRMEGPQDLMARFDVVNRAVVTC